MFDTEGSKGVQGVYTVRFKGGKSTQPNMDESKNHLTTKYRKFKCKNSVK